MIDFLMISLGAIIGANLRYQVNRWIVKYVTAVLPFGTLIINITGSFILGFFLAWTVERVLIDPRWRLLIAIGFCGSYTTFSSYSYETFKLFEQGSIAMAVLNFVFNNVFSLLASILGVLLARAI